MRARDPRSDGWDGARVYVAALVALVAVAGPAVAAHADSAASGTGPGIVINVNTASLEELQYLPGVGETRARAILAERKTRGGFKSVDELIEVKGIGATSLERLRPHARVAGKTEIPGSQQASPRR